MIVQSPSVPRAESHSADSGLTPRPERRWLTRADKVGALAPAARAALRTEQRAWLKQRDPTCRKRIEGMGSLAPLEYSACQKELTDKRVRQLDAKSAK